MSMYRTAIQRRSARGDPGLLGFLGKVAGGIVKAIPGVGNVVSAIGSVAGALKKPAGGTRLVAAPRSPAINVAQISAVPPILRGVGGILGRGVTTGLAGYGAATAAERIFGGQRKRYRRINACNPKALRRAIRRVQKFGEFARAAGYSRPPRMLKGVGFPKKRRR